ncbi:integrase [Legionella sp. km535]|uniref:integrase n=1 Tax=Legionella sp. km535 TaxID=2498107 RepID=UPI0013159E84|nr:integrase [Legionella sp. km535]
MELYLKNLSKRYKAASKREKGSILQELCEASGYHKKHAIRLLNTAPKRPKRKMKTGRPNVYPEEQYQEPLKRIWLLSDQPCGKRLKMILPLWLPFYEEAYEAIEHSVYEGLLSMSAATIDRLLTPLRVKYKRSYGGTKPGSILKKHIPVKTNQWDEHKPGYLEADTVAHCGSSLSGNFVWSLTMTDICSGWTELRAVWNKGATGVVSQIEDIEHCLPFLILGFDCDNGSEFLNWHLMHYFSNEEGAHRIHFTRSRPYHSDDNAHVEQKNWTHVRQLFGYARFDNQALVALMNDLYKNEVSQMNNFFLPNFKLIEKQRVQAKIIKKHSKPETPYQRLMKSEFITVEKKAELTETYNQLNPFKLQKAIQKKLKRIFAIVNIKTDSKMNYI